MLPGFRTAADRVKLPRFIYFSSIFPGCEASGPPR